MPHQSETQDIQTCSSELSNPHTGHTNLQQGELSNPHTGHTNLQQGNLSNPQLVEHLLDLVEIQNAMLHFVDSGKMGLLGEALNDVSLFDIENGIERCPKTPEAETEINNLLAESQQNLGTIFAALRNNETPQLVTRVLDWSKVRPEPVNESSQHIKEPLNESNPRLKPSLGDRLRKLLNGKGKTSNQRKKILKDGNRKPRLFSAIRGLPSRGNGKNREI